MSPATSVPSFIQIHPLLLGASRALYPLPRSFPVFFAEDREKTPWPRWPRPRLGSSRRFPREIHPSALLASVISPRSFSNGRYGQTERGRRRQFRFQTPQVRNYNSTKFHDNPCIPSIGSPFPIYFPRASRSFSPRTAGLIGLSRLGLFPALFLMDGTGKRRKGESGNSVYQPLMSRTPTLPSFSSIRACNL